MVGHDHKRRAVVDAGGLHPGDDLPQERVDRPHLEQMALPRLAHQRAVEDAALAAVQPLDRPQHRAVVAPQLRRENPRHVRQQGVLVVQRGPPRPVDPGDPALEPSQPVAREEVVGSVAAAAAAVGAQAGGLLLHLQPVAVAAQEREDVAWVAAVGGGHAHLRPPPVQDRGDGQLGGVGHRGGVGIPRRSPRQRREVGIAHAVDAPAPVQ